MSKDEVEGEKKPPLPDDFRFRMGTLTTTSDPELRRKVDEALRRIERREEAQAQDA